MDILEKETNRNDLSVYKKNKGGNGMKNDTANNPVGITNRIIAPSYYFKDILTAKEATDYLGIAPGSIYQYIHRKQIPCYKPSKGQVYFKKLELDEFMLQNKKYADYEISKQADAILNGEQKMCSMKD